MIVTAQAPCRISLFGGGTDIEPFVSEQGAVIISLAITLRQYVTLYTGDDMWGHLRDTFPNNATPQFLYDIYHEFGYPGGHSMKLDSKSDSFLSSGLGSSSAAAVAALATIVKAKDLSMSPHEMVMQARQAENAQGWFGGLQDQIASVYGGMNIIEIGGKLGEFHRVTPFTRHVSDYLKHCLVLFYTGERRIVQPQENLRKQTVDQAKAMQTIRDSVEGAMWYIQQGDLEKLGKLMEIGWKLKKQSNPNVTNDKLEELFAEAKKAGAFGGKILGAGSGGYAVFIVDPTKKKEFLTSMSPFGMENIDFDIDYQGVTARILEN